MASKKVTLLKSKRQQLKGAVTRFRKYVDTLKDGEVDFWELKARKNKFINLMEQFDALQSEIELLENNDDEEERIEFEKNYFGLLAACEKLTVGAENTGNIAKRGEIHGQDSATEQVRLPPIELKSFSGQYEEWHPFFQLFKSMIHDNGKLNNVQKFHYLRSSLVGEAADVVGSLEITSEGYTEAWNLLTDRYDNRRLIIQNHIKAIVETPSLGRENCAGLRKLVDNCKRHLRALTALGSDAAGANDLMIYLIMTKVDQNTLKEWEGKLTKNCRPTLEDLFKFLTHKCDTLEAIQKPQVLGSKQGTFQAPFKRGPNAMAALEVLKRKCIVCNGDHSISTCEQFKRLNPNERHRRILEKGLCINCLKAGSHMAKDCFSGSCKLCGKKHNILLHERFAGSKESKTVIGANHSVNPRAPDQVMLSTVSVNVLDSEGELKTCRALLDSGSQSDFITKNLLKRLGLPETDVNVEVIGIGQRATQTFKRADIQIKSRTSQFQVRLKPLVLNKITEAVPLNTFNKTLIHIPKHLVLADPKFNISGEIDMLLGAQTFWNCMREQSIQIKGQPRLQNTEFGWVIAGGWESKANKKGSLISNLASVRDDILDLTKFWKLEEVSNENEFSPDEKYCLNHFKETYKRTEDGRFVVQLPVKTELVSQLKNNKEVALKRFFNLEAKLNKNVALKTEYASFLREYEKLGHMKEVVDDENKPLGPTYYMPHHCVFNENSKTTKLRVVFDASCKGHSLSLNDVLMTGPVLQQDLFSILSRFRTFKYVLTSDIRKMYRQVKVFEQQTPLQRIFWRESREEKMKTYELLTVTYGTSPASFLAINSVQELARLEGAQYPLGAKIALRDFYVDDLITGANTKEEIFAIQEQMTSLLNKGKFELAKWCSNLPELLKMLDPECVTQLTFDKDDSLKTLGVKWWPVSDEFGYTMNLVSKEGLVTKRNILSTIARIFDPLGLIGPYIVTAKMLLQKIWELKLNWDEEAPDAIKEEWKGYLTRLKELEILRVPRKVICTTECTKIELHGFCDASERAYGACLYIRTVDKNNACYSYLLCSKSKVAPIKTITLPRLELCAAVLLTKLYVKVKNCLEVKFNKVYFWSDSKIVLAWLRASSKKWSIFVAHRVGEIQECTAVEDWRHVGSEENPADIISRGCQSKSLLSLDIWWSGPKWLYDSKVQMPSEEGYLEEDQVPERKKIVANCTVREKFNLFERCGTFAKLLRVMAYVNRFIKNCKIQKEDRRKEKLTIENLEEAERTLIKLVQAEEFSEEIRMLRQDSVLPKASKLANLKPFLDLDGIIRVGGRLSNSDLPYNTKHPVVLPAKHRFTLLFMIHEHRRLLHSGLEATLAAVREKYWPLGMKSSLKKIIRDCIICRKADPKPIQYVMGNLPKARTVVSRPFLNTGVDYCGPFLIKESKRRTCKMLKIYVVVFVCMAVKAVHIELATDISTEGFISALKRLMARRGIVKSIFSDNATNFVGASKVITNVDWHFIPPRAPNFGGLWEAAVKSYKRVLKRIIGETKLTYEEFYTLSVEIEAVLNSRPVTPLSTDPNDFSCLTPGHFLVGENLTTIPDRGDISSTINYNNRWELVKRLRQHFWKRWEAEYLRSCQERNKWKSGGQAVVPGQLVMVQRDESIPLKWTLGRVIQVFSGNDGVVRVATVKTMGGEFKRAVSKLAPLPEDAFHQMSS